ncbi:hypothetical protein GCM10007103_08110 [Salinimicrobium marinum]|uniref:Uncharacterized protein n=1 Tax=Salinimicrobium marinum TaxID=680283 RepID=A0A918VVS6_9FLAO|nr:hypothetical protein [Salinimicrobium marinum]GHA29274.1 hypothetical protein GCM10007103_08110 [Salinimicrobium marinum]
MDAKTVYTILKPHLDKMEPQEKRSLSNLIVGLKKKKPFKSKRRVLSLSKAKERIRQFRKKEIEREFSGSLGA